MEKTRFKLIKTFLMLFLTVIFCTMGIDCVNAATNPTINKTEIDLYALPSTYESKLSIPANYPKSFQLTVKNASSVTYSVISGESAEVSKTGLVSPKITVWYEYDGYSSTGKYEGYKGTHTTIEEGDTVIKVTADGKTFNVNVHVHNYVYTYVDNEMQKYINENISPSMSAMEKLEAIARYPASFDYNYRYSSAVSMVVMGGGDCWASTDAIIKMCKMLGIDAWSRNGNKDSGAGSGHMNAMAYLDGKYYELEAGFAGTAPRYYYVKERNSLFDCIYRSSGAFVYQYSGKEIPSVFEIPDTINGYTVIGIEEGAFKSKKFEKVILPDSLKSIGDFAFSACTQLKEINIPANVEEIGEGIFAQCNSLAKLNLSSSNPYYKKVNGVIYDKSMKRLVTAPYVSKIVIPDGVEEISNYSIYYNYNLTSLEIPGSVTYIGEGAVGDCNSLSSVLIKGKGLSYIGQHAFRECTSLKGIVLPSSLSTIETHAFYYDTKLKYILFCGDEPTFGTTESGQFYDSSFYGVTATVYYQTGNTTWNKNNHGGDITWKTWDVCSGFDVTQLVNGSVTTPGHKKVVDKAIEPTCTKAGKTEGSSCSACGKVYVAQKSVAALGHVKVVEPEVKPTCTKDGNKKWSYCSRCNAVLTAKVVVPATGHTVVNDIGYKADCTHAGLTDGSHCSTCNAIIKKQTVIPALGHEEVVVKGYEPTCTEKGVSDKIYCKVCRAILQDKKTLPAKGHSYSEVVSKASETKNGLVTTKCLGCGEVKDKAVVYKISGVALSKTEYYYDNCAKKPAVVVVDSTGETLTLGKDYNVKYDANCVSEGKHKVIVTFSGYYSGTKTLEYEIKKLNASVKYKTHVQSFGWQDYVKNGVASGTTGKAKRLEGICINLESKEFSGDIEYRTHVQTYGWQNYVKNGAMSGTTGEAKRLEAIQIRLTGEMAAHYDIYYRVHAQHYGWLGWAKNGQAAGTAGYAYRLEAIEIKLVKKGGAAPGSTANPYYSKNSYAESTSVKLDKSSLSMAVGSTQKLTASILPGNVLNNTISWYSSDTEIVKVIDGKLTAISKGTVVITAKTTNGKTATCKITVK